jgi:hypothetical protein
MILIRNSRFQDWNLTSMTPNEVGVFICQNHDNGQNPYWKAVVAYIFKKRHRVYGTPMVHNHVHKSHKLCNWNFITYCKLTGYPKARQPFSYYVATHTRLLPISECFSPIRNQKINCSVMKRYLLRMEVDWKTVKFPSNFKDHFVL